MNIELPKINRNNPGVGRDRAERVALLRRREMVADLITRGLSQQHVASRMGVSRITIYKDLVWIEKQWLKAMEGSRGRWLAEEFARIGKIEHEAWEAWDKSKLEKTTRSVRVKDGKESKEITTTTSCGDTSYMAVIQWCSERRCKLRGLDAPSKVELTGADGGPIKVQETARPGDEAWLELAAIMKKAASQSRGQLEDLRMLPSAGITQGDVEPPVELSEWDDDLDDLVISDSANQTT